MNSPTKYTQRFLDPHMTEDGKIRCGDVEFTAEDVTSRLQKHMTDERFAKIEQVTKKRTLDLIVVLEDIYDRGNASAVMRSADGMGVQNVHMVKPTDKFKESARVTQGADKWLDVKEWKSTTDCVQEIKTSGYQLIVTHLESATPIEEIDFSIPTAVVLGNEKRGVTEEMAAAADKCIIIPMAGFTQSFNISVAGALLLYHIRRAVANGPSDVSAEEAKILQALYCLKSVDSAEKILLS